MGFSPCLMESMAAELGVKAQPTWAATPPPGPADRCSLSSSDLSSQHPNWASSSLECPFPLKGHRKRPHFPDHPPTAIQPQCSRVSMEKCAQDRTKVLPLAESLAPKQAFRSGSPEHKSFICCVALGKSLSFSVSFSVK